MEKAKKVEHDKHKAEHEKKKEAQAAVRKQEASNAVKNILEEEKSKQEALDKKEKHREHFLEDLRKKKIRREWKTT